MKTYREYIHDICTDTDLNDKESVTETLQMLAKEAVDNHDLLMTQEAKLQEVMSYKDYTEWTSKVAREMFCKDINGMPDGEFKDFVLKHFDEIVGDDDETD